MPRRSLDATVAFILISLIAPLACIGQVTKSKAPVKERTPNAQQDPDRPVMSPPSGASFYIAPIQDNPGQFSVLFSDADNRTVADSFRLEQLIIFEAIMSEAKQFALTDEAVGLKKPVTTRFFDKKEPSLIVDVAKLGNRSQFVLTIKCLTGRLTMDAGSIKRGDEKASPLFYDILSRIQEARTNAQS